MYARSIGAARLAPRRAQEKRLVSSIKVVAPRVALKVVDESIQMFGGQGISQDTPLAAAWTYLRTLRLADGPDAVHRRQVARSELRKFSNLKV